MDYTYSYEVNQMSGGAVFFNILVAAYTIFVMWKVFEKAGKPGWAALVPVYNLVVLFQIMGLNPLLLLLLIIPFLGWLAVAILIIVGYVNLAKAFGKESVFAVGLIFLNVIFMSILAFDDSTYTPVK